MPPLDLTKFRKGGNLNLFYSLMLECQDDDLDAIIILPEALLIF